MLKGKTPSGFELDENILDDYELLESLQAIDNGDYGKVTQTISYLLGEEQKERLKEHVRKENGRVSVIAMMNEVAEIFQANSSLKN